MTPSLQQLPEDKCGLVKSIQKNQEISAMLSSPHLHTPFPLPGNPGTAILNKCSMHVYGEDPPPPQQSAQQSSSFSCHVPVYAAA